MDYKTFLNKYKKTYDQFFKYATDGINKNVLKADEIVTSYLEDISKGSYSLKSYKAKIIRNEQEHHQNDDEKEEKNKEIIDFDILFKILMNILVYI